jgi:hypothetical protein
VVVSDINDEMQGLPWPYCSRCTGPLDIDGVCLRCASDDPRDVPLVSPAQLFGGSDEPREPRTVRFFDADGFSRASCASRAPWNKLAQIVDRITPENAPILAAVLAEVAEQKAGRGIDGDACSPYEGMIANAAFHIIEAEARRLSKEGA